MNISKPQKFGFHHTFFFIFRWAHKSCYKWCVFVSRFFFFLSLALFWSNRTILGPGKILFWDSNLDVIMLEPFPLENFKTTKVWFFTTKTFFFIFIFGWAYKSLHIWCVFPIPYILVRLITCSTELFNFDFWKFATTILAKSNVRFFKTVIKRPPTPKINVERE